MRRCFDIKTNILEALLSLILFISQYDCAKRTELSEPVLFIIAVRLRILTLILIKRMTMEAVPMFIQFVQQIFLS